MHKDLAAGTCKDALTLETSCSPLFLPHLEAFVIPSALLVQLENSTGITAHLPEIPLAPAHRRELFFTFSKMPPCRQWRPGEAIHLVWNCTLTLCLRLMSLSRLLQRVTAHKNRAERVPLKGARICWCRKDRSLGSAGLERRDRVKRHAKHKSGRDRGQTSGHSEWRRMPFTSNRYDNCPNAHYKRVLFG